jgi:hypothetical protein
MAIGDDFCYISHNCPYEEVASLAMASQLQFCPHASMHSNNKNSLVGFVGRMHFWVQTQTKTMTPQLAPFLEYKTNAKVTQS